MDEAGIGPVSSLNWLFFAVAVWQLWWMLIFAFPTENDGPSVQQADGDPQEWTVGLKTPFENGKVNT